MAITRKQFLARALLWKQKYKIAATYRDPDYEGGKSYPYEGEDKYAIFNWFRREFPYYNRFTDNKELTQRFWDDYQRGDPLLLKDVAEQTVPAEPSESEPTAGAPKQAAGAGEPTSTMSEGGIPPLPTFSTSPTITRVNPQVKPPQVKTYPKPPVVETGLDYEGKPYEVSQKTPSTTGSTVGRRFQAPKMPVGFTNAAKRLGSGLGRFIQGSSSRLATGLSRLLGGMAGAGGRGLIGLGLRASYAMVDLSNQLTRSSLIKLPSGRVGLLLLGSFLLLILATGFIGAIPAEQPSPQAPQPSPTTYTPGALSGLISCPLNGAVTITNGSKDALGHCSPSYEAAYGVCVKLGSTGYTGKDTAIDVTSSDRLVFLPRVQGASQAKWIVDEAGNVPITEGEGGGISVAARTTVSNKTYRIRFVHLESTNLKIGDSYDAGTAVGQYYLNNPYGAHAHITLQEDEVFKPADTYFNLCR